MTYTISLSDGQRLLLIELLARNPATIQDHIKRCSTSSEGDNLTYLLPCLKQLSADEAQTPGVLHDLCL